MNDPQNNGPSRETLKRLSGMMPSFIRGLQEKTAVGKGKPVGVWKARKCCPICSKMFDKIHTTADVSIETKMCERCDGMIKDGCIAVVCGDKFAFVKSPSLVTLPEKIVTISSQNMQKIEAEYKTNWEKKADADV